MPNTFKIDFENNPSKTVYAGQLIRGTVQLLLEKKTIVRCIYIRINGRANVRWQNGRTRVTNEEKYLDKRVNLFGGSTGGVRLEPGTYNYTFEFMLPSDVPSTFHGKFGQIKYKIRVVIDVPRGLSNTEFKEEFTLIKALNLNDDTSLRQPLIVEKINGVFPLCFCCFNSNKLKIIARAPVSGYLPQQTFDLEINVNNQSKLAIAQFKIELIQLITYFAKTLVGCSKGCGYKYKRLEERCLLKTISDGCNEREEKIIHVAIDIPQTLPTEIVMSKPIKISYLIRVKALMPSLYINRSLDLPITVGSYPFQDDTAIQPNMP